MVSLATGEEVRVSEQFNNHPVTLNFDINNQGLPLIAVWPGDGDFAGGKGWNRYLGPEVMVNLNHQKGFRLENGYCCNSLQSN